MDIVISPIETKKSVEQKKIEIKNQNHNNNRTNAICSRAELLSLI